MEKNYDVIPYETLDTFLTLPGEKTVLVKRQHIFSLLIPLGFIALFVLSLIGASYVVFSTFFFSPQHFFFSSIAFLLMGVSISVKLFVDWHFHTYIVTSRRILEIRYQPLFAQDVNDVLLDQVRCTEIDVKIHGYIHGLLDIGDVIITFDRPTHQQEFILHDIPNPRKIGTLLGHLLNTPKVDINNSRPIWVKDRGNPYSFSDELFPKRPMPSL